MTRRPSQQNTKRSTRRSDSEAAGTSRASRGRSTRSRRQSQQVRPEFSASSRSQKSSTASRKAQPARSDRPANSSSSRGKANASAAARDERRRARTKARASKMYDRQVPTGSAARGSAQEAEGAPRAALYKGKMGSTHRKSARMQRVADAGPVSAKINPAGWFSNVSISPRVLKVVTAALCVALTAVFLYVPAQHYYQAQREHDRLSVEYATIEERNAALDFQNDALASNAGMEDAVRQKYGYIVSGEQTAVVTGLSDETLEQLHGASSVEANVLSSSVKAPEEWYTPLLDAFFGVE